MLIKGQQVYLEQHGERKLVTIYAVRDDGVIEVIQ